MATIDLLTTAPVSPAMAAYIENYSQIAAEDVAAGVPSFQMQDDLILRAQRDLRRIGNVQGLRVLEVGPGYGHLALLMEQAGGQVSVADLVPHYMSRLAHSLSGDQLLIDIQNSRVWSGIPVFDLVVMCDVLEHVFRPSDALISCYDALALGGRIYVRSPANESLIGYACNLNYPYELVHLRTFTRNTLKMELKAAGFSRVSRPRSLRGGSYVPRNFFAGRIFWSETRRAMKLANTDEESRGVVEGPTGSAAPHEVYGRLGDRLRRAWHAVLRGARPKKMRFIWSLTRPLTAITSRPLELSVIGTKSP